MSLAPAVTLQQLDQGLFSNWWDAAAADSLSASDLVTKQVGFNASATLKVISGWSLWWNIWWWDQNHTDAATVKPIQIWMTCSVLSSAQNNVYTLRKAHMCSAVSVSLISKFP